MFEMITKKIKISNAIHKYRSHLFYKTSVDRHNCLIKYEDFWRERVEELGIRLPQFELIQELELPKCFAKSLKDFWKWNLERYNIFWKCWHEKNPKAEDNYFKASRVIIRDFFYRNNRFPEEVNNLIEKCIWDMHWDWNRDPNILLRNRDNKIALIQVSKKAEHCN
jgi:hypothetical protein